MTKQELRKQAFDKYWDVVRPAMADLDVANANYEDIQSDAELLLQSELEEIESEEQDNE